MDALKEDPHGFDSRASLVDACASRTPRNPFRHHGVCLAGNNLIGFGAVIRGLFAPRRAFCRWGRNYGPTRDQKLDLALTCRDSWRWNWVGNLFPARSNNSGAAVA